MFNEILPVDFDEFILHRNIIEKLKKYTQYNYINMLFYGPSSCGKRTLINAFIKYLYNLKEFNTELVEFDIKINNNDVKIKTIQSKYHNEFFLYEYGLYDKHVLCDFIKEIVSSKNIINNGFKLIVLHSIDELNKNALLALRRIMELYINSCRFILIADHLNKIDDSIISRCLSIRVPYPDQKEIDLYLDNCEKILNTKLNKSKIKNKGHGNLFKLNTLIFNIDYKDPIDIFIKNIHNIIKNSNDITFIDDIRKLIYKMHLLDFSYQNIFKSYINFIINSKEFTDTQINDIINQVAICEYNCQKTSKYFFCLEKFFIYLKLTIL